MTMVASAFAASAPMLPRATIKSRNKIVLAVIHFIKHYEWGNVDQSGEQQPFIDVEK